MATPTKRELVDFARNAAQRAGINPDIFVRQIQQESGFDPNARSPAGAVGIAQIVPRFHPGVNALDPFASLNYAANLMSNYLRQFGGNYALALAAYNAGPGAVQQFGGVPPYEETQRYIRNILGDAARGALEGGLRATGLIGEGVPVATAADDIMQGPPDAPTGPDIDLGGDIPLGGGGEGDILGFLSQLGDRAQTVRIDTGNEVIVYEKQGERWVPVIRQPKAQAPQQPERETFSFQGTIIERDPATGEYRTVYVSPLTKLAQEYDAIDRALDERRLTREEAAERFDQSYRQFLSEMQRAQEQRAQFETGLQGLNVGLAERGQRLSALDAAQGRFLQALPSQALPGQEFFLGFEPTRGVTGQFTSPAATLFRGLGISFRPDLFRAPITHFNPFEQVRQVLSDFRAPAFNAPALPAPPTPTFTGTTPQTPASVPATQAPTAPLPAPPTAGPSTTPGVTPEATMPPVVPSSTLAPSRIPGITPEATMPPVVASTVNQLLNAAIRSGLVPPAGAGLGGGGGRGGGF